MEQRNRREKGVLRRGGYREEGVEGNGGLNSVVESANYGGQWIQIPERSGACKHC